MFDKQYCIAKRNIYFTAKLKKERKKERNKERKKPTNKETNIFLKLFINVEVQDQDIRRSNKERAAVANIALRGHSNNT